MTSVLQVTLDLSPACRIHAPVGLGLRPMYCLNRFSLASLPLFVGKPNSCRITLTLSSSIFGISPDLAGNPSIMVLVNRLISGVSRLEGLVR